MIDAISEAIYVQDAEGQFLDVNEGAARMYGYPRSFFIGKTPEFLSAPGRNDQLALGQAFEKALHGTPQQFDYWGLKHDGTIFPKEVRLYPGTYLGQKVIIAVAQDISERKRAEQTQQATFKLAEAALEARNTEELFPRIHAIVRGLMPAENIYIALWDRYSDVVSFPYWVDQVDAAPEPHKIDKLHGGLTEYILRTGKPLLIDTAALLEMQQAGDVDPLGTLALDWLGVPLRNDSGVFGVLVVQSYQGEHRYNSGDRDLLAFVSAQVALAIERTNAQAEQRILTAAMDCAADPVFGINITGRFDFVNQAAATSLGYTRDELLSLNLWDIDPAFDAAIWTTRWNQIRIEGFKRRETYHRRKDGTLFPVELSSNFLSREGRDIVFTHSRDISSRKVAEEALRASEEKFSKTFEASPDAININRLDGTYLDVNLAYSRLSGWSREETLGRTTMDLNLWVNLEDRTRMQEMIQAEGHFVGFEASFRMKDGSIRTGLVSGTLIPVAGETCLLTITRDITERKAAEAAIRYSEDKFSRAFHASPDAINITRLDDSTYIEVSDGFEKISGWSREEVIGRSATELNIWANPLDRFQIKELLQTHGEFTGMEISFCRKDGSLLTGMMSGKIMEVDGVPCLLSITRDISARKKAEEALAAERGLFIGGPVMVFKWRTDSGWPVEYASPNVASILGYTPSDLIDGQIPFQSLFHPDDFDRVVREINEVEAKGLSHFEQHYRLRIASGEYRWFYDFSAAATPGPNPSHFLGYLLDITDRRQAEDALRQSQKLESLGILAGGIAHDFNNLLTVVLGNLNLAQMHLPEHAAALPYLSKMEATVLRATELTKQMLAYSGRGHFLVKPLDLNEAVREVTHLLEVSISKKIRLRFDLEPGLPAILADAAQIQQVVMNLVTNASDAIGDQDGIIHLTTSTANLEARELLSDFRSETLAPGPFVLLEVADTGIGMTPEVMARIFDPFYTTKTAGRGLGLSAMLGILRGHNAGIQLRSEVGRGSTFRLCFPASDERPGTLDAAIQEVLSHPLHGRILLVDDEELILQTIGSALKMLGLEVITAQDGLEALQLFRETKPRVDLVLMDLTMPRMDGREAFEAMHDLDPSVPVVLSSGFTERDSLQTLSGEGPAAFMQKPYQIKELRLLLQMVLGD
jgi:PAS domain S-box-containing protein